MPLRCHLHASQMPPTCFPPSAQHDADPLPCCIAVQTALRDYAPPWVEWVSQPQDANIQLLHMLDSRDLAQIKLSDRMVVIQHVTITCMDMKPPAMVELWKRALLVASFHNLGAMVAKYAPFDQQHIRCAALHCSLLTWQHRCVVVLLASSRIVGPDHAKSIGRG
jgi:hypothetical protein